MRPVVARCFVATVILGCGGATCLYSGAGPIDAGGPAMRGTWSPALARIADLLTIPIPTAGIADVRDVALLVCAGALLIVAGLSRTDGETWTPAMRWISTMASAVIVLAIFSAVAWHSLDLSWGWIVRFAAGVALALVIAQRFSAGMVRQTAAGLLAVGVAALLLSIWHRADRGYAYFLWPIGPITITGAMAGVWAALAGVLGIGYAMGRRDPWRAIAALAACALCLYVLEQTERRSPVMGLIAGGVASTAVAVWRHYPRKSVRLAICAGIGTAIISSIAYVVMQSKSSDREKSGSIAVRRAYWGPSARMIREHLLLGIGPDRFVIEMTKAIAPLRAEMPHVYHGNLDTAAHNEWLQAMVELGLPAGLAYAALPIGAIFLAVRSKARRLQSAGFEGARPLDDGGVVLFALAGAIVSLVVCEAASINLRGPILPIWYWVLLGLLAAMARAPRSTTKVGAQAKTTGNRLRPILLIASGAICLVLSFSEMIASIDQERGQLASPLVEARLFAERSLDGRYSNAAKMTRVSTESATAQSLVAAADSWKAIFELLPVYRDTAARYAESLIGCGRRDEAQRVLESYISSGLSPYDISANKVYASLLERDAIGQFRCVQRAVRGSAWRDFGGELFRKYTRTPEAGKILDAELAGARRAAKSNDPVLLRGANVELLRINAILQLAARKNDDAIADQRLAAECYQRLERENNPYRRASNAEWEAFYDLAFMRFSANPGDYRAAYDDIVEAERFAVLGIRHEKIAHPDPARGFVGGEVVPTEFPERLRPLWSMSTTLHMAVGNWQDLDQRVFASLPPERWTADEVLKKKASEAAFVYQKLSRLKSGRPPYLDQLRKMAEEADTAPAMENPP